MARGRWRGIRTRWTRSRTRRGIIVEDGRESCRATMEPVVPPSRFLKRGRRKYSGGAWRVHRRRSCSPRRGATTRPRMKEQVNRSEICRTWIGKYRIYFQIIVSKDDRIWMMMDHWFRTIFLVDDGSSLSEACSTPIIGAGSRAGSSHTVIDVDDMDSGLHSGHLATRASLSSLGVSNGELC